MFRRKYCKTSIYVTVGLFLVSSCLSCSPAKPSFNKNVELRIAARATRPSLNSLKVRTIIDAWLIDMISDALIRTTMMGELLPGLAKSWHFESKASKFVLQLDDALIERLGFQKTNIVEALNRHFDPKLKSSSWKFFEETVKTGEKFVLNGNEISISLKKYYPLFAHLLVKSSLVIKSPKGSAGPYEVLEYKDSSISLKKNPISPLSEKAFFKSIKIYYFDDMKPMLAAHKKKPFHVIMGTPFADAKKWSNLFALNLRTYDSIGFLHIFFNMSRSIDFKIRTRLVRIFKNSRDSVERNIESLRPLNQFLPRGLIPTYTNYTEQKNSNEARPPVSRPLDFIYSKSFLPGELIKRAQELTKKGEINFHELGPVEFRKRLLGGQYDLASLSYQTTMPDPDGILLSLRDNAIPGINISLNNVNKAVKAYRFESDLLKRSEHYKEAFIKFEKKANHISLYQIKIPILFHEHLRLPDMNFQYLKSLWQVHPK